MRKRELKQLLKHYSDLYNHHYNFNPIPWMQHSPLPANFTPIHKDTGIMDCPICYDTETFLKIHLDKRYREKDLEQFNKYLLLK